MQERLTEILMNLIASEVCEHKAIDLTKEALSDSFWESLYCASKSHDMAHIVGAAVEKQGINIPPEIAQKFRKQQMLAVYRYQQLQYELAEICRVLEEAEIQFVPLKGSVIRRYYPQPWMRTSCDIDILVREENVDQAIKALTEILGYTQKGDRNYHDVSLYSSSGVHLELHFSLQENMENIDGLLSRVWEYVVPISGAKYQCQPTDEFFLFHHIAHMSYHFINGGCGIKPFLDLHLMLKKIQFDYDKVRGFCSDCGLRIFFDHVEEMQRVWFDGAAQSNITLQIQSYILQGGVYGILENSIAAKQGRKGGKNGYARSRIFLNFRTLANYYPCLHRHKWLMPFCHIHRWFKILTNRKRLKRSLNELKVNRSTSEQKVTEMQAFLNEIGL